MDLNFAFPSGDESGGLGVTLGVPLVARNVLIIEPYAGISGIIPPRTPVTDGVGRYTYGFALALRPVAIQTRRDGSWSYPFVGLRWKWVTGLGTGGDPLDCLYCGYYTERYEGPVTRWLSLGYMWRHLLVRLDLRQSGGIGWAESSGWDPYDVGPSYDYVHGPYEEPPYQLAVTWYGLWEF
jgi:hypothetical protein